MGIPAIVLGFPSTLSSFLWCLKASSSVRVYHLEHVMEAISGWDVAHHNTNNVIDATHAAFDGMMQA